MVVVKIKDRMLANEKFLSEFACRDKDCIRLKENIDDFRGNYGRDVDRIIHSISYTKYMDKTQVFSLITDDFITKRMLHVQLVSKIARTIGRALQLNEDLIEAIALGHDIGHVPFGHVGEAILNEISIENGEGVFAHNVQSARTMMYVEKNGHGANLSVQTLDGMLCHNGEFVQDKYTPVKKTKEQFLEDYENCYKDPKYIKSLRPMTLEGCVVRISDIVGYIGRDIEDAIRLGMISIDEFPQNIKETLGTSNKEIVNTIIKDVIKNSLDKDYIKMSKEVYTCIKELKQFNYDHIYIKSNTKEQIEFYTKGFNVLFSKYLSDIENNNENSEIYRDFLSTKLPIYMDNTNHKRMVIDFLAGMTDEYFLDKCNKYM